MASVIRLRLAVVDALDVELRAAIRAVEQSRQWVSITPTVWAAFDIGAYALNRVKGFIVDDALVRVLKDNPFIFGNIVIALVLITVFCGLEIYGVG